MDTVFISLQTGRYTVATGSKVYMMARERLSGVMEESTVDLGKPVKRMGLERKLILMAPFVTMESGPMIDQFVTRGKA